MILLENTLISNDLKEVMFCCDLQVCKGACCVDGDAGAPLEAEEISLLEDYREELMPYLRFESIEIIRNLGVFDYDADGNFVTPLVRDKECVYAIFEKGCARCAIEKAFSEKAIPFRKPVSCHLYPVRLKALNGGKTAINYHAWDICVSALEKGRYANMPLWLFLEDSLIRKFGKKWFSKLAKSLR